MRLRQNGFTLLETMVTASVFGVMTVVAFPSMSRSLTAHRLTAGLRKTVGIVRVARSAAISRNQATRILLSSDKQTLTVQTASSVTSSTWTSIGNPVYLDNGISISSSSTDPGFRFDNTGVLKDSSGSNLSNGATLTLTTGAGSTKSVTISLLGGVDLS